MPYLPGAAFVPLRIVKPCLSACAGPASKIAAAVATIAAFGANLRRRRALRQSPRCNGFSPTRVD